MVVEFEVFAHRASEVMADSARWLHAAAAEFVELSDVWELTDAKVVVGGRGGLLVQACRNGHRVAVKRPFVNAVAAAEVTWSYAVHGLAPMVLQRSPGGWVMLEWVPAATLTSALTLENITAAGRVLVDAGNHPAPDGVPLFAVWLANRLRNVPQDVSKTSRRPSDGDRAAALEVLDGLSDVVGLCHGDANPGNFLLAPAGVLTIDHRGFVGDLCADVAALWLKTPVCSSVTVSEFAAAVGADPVRVQAWVSVVAAARI